jgi:hypothetical protein
VNRIVREQGRSLTEVPLYLMGPGIKRPGREGGHSSLSSGVTTKVRGSIASVRIRLYS